MNMEILGKNDIVNSKLDTATMKITDCYFYYYSSCNKGDACPYRHEPAALRNETMCMYWLKGSCNKPNCIYRHMEIMKNRNKIQCFFETQPGGCKKLHCPFLHNNVLDQPREEDVPNKSDLILPVKDSEADYETEKSELKKLQENVLGQLKLHRNLSYNKSNSDSFLKDNDSPVTSPFPSLHRQSFIVSLQDGESDSECASPVKETNDLEGSNNDSEESNWEVERLREIQEEEGNLLGYSFASEEDENGEEEEDVSSNSFSFAHKISSRLSFSPSYSNSANNIERFSNTEYEIATPSIPQRSLHADRHLPVVDEGRDTHHGANNRRVLLADSNDSFQSYSYVNDHLLPDSPSIRDNVFQMRGNASFGLQSVNLNEKLSRELVKPSAKDRLGPVSLNHDVHVKSLDAGRISNTKPTDKGNVKNRISLGNYPVPKSKFSYDDVGFGDKIEPKSKFSSNDVTRKSLDELITEKGKLKRNKSTPTMRFSTEPLPLSAYIDRIDLPMENKVDLNLLKIKTLSEIKADKRKIRFSSYTQAKLPISLKQTKRPISPITFNTNIVDKKIKISSKNLGQNDCQNSNSDNFTNLSHKFRSLSHVKTKEMTVDRLANSEFNNRRLNLKQKCHTNKTYSSNIASSNPVNRQITSSTNFSNRSISNYNPKSLHTGGTRRNSSYPNDNSYVYYTANCMQNRQDSYIDEDTLLQGEYGSYLENEDIDEDLLLS